MTIETDCYVTKAHVFVRTVELNLLYVEAFGKYRG